MLTQHDRAFKEWAVVCDALKTGRQIVLVRKGGIREEEGVFRISDPEFFLMPTYEHQNPMLVQPEFVPSIEASQRRFDQEVLPELLRHPAVNSSGGGGVKHAGRPPVSDPRWAAGCRPRSW